MKGFVIVSDRSVLDSVEARRMGRQRRMGTDGGMRFSRVYKT